MLANTEGTLNSVILELAGFSRNIRKYLFGLFFFWHRDLLWILTKIMSSRKFSSF